MKTGCTRQFRWVVLFMLFTWVGASFSAEYRAFKNQSGKTIHARIVQYDADAGKVELELKNRKKAWVEISTLSDEDQAFIKQRQQGQSSVNSSTERSGTDEAEKKLSRSEIRTIAKQYVEAIDKTDYGLLRSLFSDQEGRGVSKDFHNWAFVGVNDASFSSRSPYSSAVSAINRSIASVDGYNVEINFQRKEGEDDDNCWIQLLPDGKIKYDFLVFLHPFAKSEKALYELARAEKYNKLLESPDVSGALRDLQGLAVPLFGYDPKASEREREKSIEQIAEWLLKKEEDWDITEPKLAFPKDRYRIFKKRIKLYR